jgi:hypothetical protein
MRRAESNKVWQTNSRAAKTELRTVHLYENALLAAKYGINIKLF